MASVAARRLNKLLPEAKILLTVRNQYTLAPSYYANHGRILKNVPGRWNGREISFHEWLTWSEENPHHGFFFVNNYYRLGTIYSRVFGRENIFITLYEDLSTNKEYFAESLSKLLQIGPDEIHEALTGPAVNPRASNRRVQYQQLRSRFCPNINLSGFIPGGRGLRRLFNQFLESGTAFSGELSDMERKRMQEIISESNLLFMQEFGVDLARHDYPLPSI